MNTLNSKPIPIYGNGLNIRDFLFDEDHINALLVIANKKKSSSHYCIGGGEEKSNINICKEIFNLLDDLKPQKSSYLSLIEFVDDRHGHDFRYGIDFTLIFKEPGWKPLLNLINQLKKPLVGILAIKIVLILFVRNQNVTEKDEAS